MKTVLLGWELGANLGHAMPLAELARRVDDDDIRLIAVARDLAAARIAFADLDIPVVQAPVWPPHQHFGSETGEAGYLDVLVNVGFADPLKLAAMVEGWLALFDLIQPDAIVADHSPALLLAAKIRSVPVVHVGTGFTMPPVDYDRLPPIRADRAPIMPESRIMAAVSAVAAQHRAPAPPALIDIFRTRGRIVFGCPEIDPYAPFRREPLHLPPETLPEFLEPPVEPKLFVYLGSEVPNIDRLLQMLAGLDVPLSVYLRGELGGLARFLSLRGHHVFDQPPRLADALLNVSHVLAGAGAFTCQAALAAGRPLLAVPLHGEAELNALAMERLGVMRRLDPWGNESSMRDATLAFLRDHRLLRQARLWAKTFALRNQPDGGRAAIEAIHACLSGISAAPEAQRRL